MGSPAVSERLARLGETSWTENWTRGGPALHGEIMQLSTRSVWLCQEPVTLAQYAELELPEGFTRSGLGRSEHDSAFFRRSPGEPRDGRLETMRVGELSFARVARAGALEAGREGAIVLAVEKHHRVMFNAGRTIEVLDCGDGLAYLPMASGISAPPTLGIASTSARVVPDGWSVRLQRLEQELIVEIPCPARVVLFASGEGFHGPCSIEPPS